MAQTYPIRVAAILAALFLSSGCVTVTVYQPLQSLSRPVVIDHQVANFEGARFLVRCIPSEMISVGDSSTLCRKVSAMLRNQGAEVDEEVPSSPGASYAMENKPELIIDLRARLLYVESNSWLTYLSAATLTLIPAIQEENFAADVTVRDGNGFLLASDSLQARFIQYIGIGVWSVNYVLDLATRPPEEEVTGNAASQQFSTDYYRQLSQLVLDARMRGAILRGFAPAPKPEVAPN